MKTHRVVVTAMGVVTPIGIGIQSFFDGLSTGHSGISKIDNFDVSTFPVRIGGEIKNKGLAETIKKSHILSYDLLRYNFFDRKILFSLLALDDLLYNLGIDKIDKIDKREEIAEIEEISFLKKADLIFGSGLEELLFEDVVRLFSAEKKIDYKNVAKILNGNPARYFVHTIEDWPAQYLAALMNSQGTVVTDVSACAASAQSVGVAYQRIKHGLNEIALAGGVDSMLNPCG
ncbi:MAG: hypothetical protein HQK53_09985 [Oligoflexia bacterium]|nr:hypothetical protein [Oligoflexia bacterium]